MGNHRAKANGSPAALKAASSAASAPAVIPPSPKPAPRKHEVTLAVPQAIDAANLIIIGQLALLYSNVLFQLGAAWLGDVKPMMNKGASLVLLLVLLVPPIILINILSGWISTRSTFEEFEEYPNSIFMLDVLMITVFFMMINMVSFSVLPSGTSNYLTSLIFSSNASTTSTAPAAFPSASASPLESTIVQVLPPFIYICCGIILMLYVAWNKYHALERSRLTGIDESASGIGGFNVFLYSAIFLHGVMVFVSIFTDAIEAEFVCAIFWAAVWLYLNVYWLIKSPLSISAKKNQ